MENQNPQPETQTITPSDVQTMPGAIVGGETQTTESKYTPTRVFLNPATGVDLQSKINQANEFCQLKQLGSESNIPAEGLPQNYGVGIIPVTKRNEDGTGNEIHGVFFAAIPTVIELQQTEQGQQFIADMVQKALLAKVANAVRPRGDEGKTANVIPFSVQEFIERARSEGIMEAFNEFAGDMVTALKKKNVSITKKTLRMCLSNAAFANEAYKNQVPDAQWLRIIDLMETKANSEGMNVAIYKTWRDTRSEQTYELEEADLSDLSFD